MQPLQRLLQLSPGKIAGGYLLFGVGWITLSDRVVAAMSSSQASLTALQTFKGWLFVLLSATLILGLTRTREGQVEAFHDKLLTATQELQVLHRIFRHNIRNDLNVIRGNVDLVRSEIEHETGQRLEQVHRTANRIIEMSEKLAIISEANLRTNGTGSIDVVPVIRAEVDRLRQRHPDVDVTMELPEEARIGGDHSLGYVIRELLENAVDHHPGPGEACRLAITIDQSMTSTTVQLVDNGPGIPESELTPIRSGVETPLLHGSGVGLWLVKWLCNVNDGAVRFEAIEGEGTTVSLEFVRDQPLDLVAEMARNGPLASAEA